MWDELKNNSIIRAFLTLVIFVVAGLAVARYLSPVDWALQTVGGASFLGLVAGWLVFKVKVRKDESTPVTVKTDEEPNHTLSGPLVKAPLASDLFLVLNVTDSQPSPSRVREDSLNFIDPIGTAAKDYDLNSDLSLLPKNDIPRSFLSQHWQLKKHSSFVEAEFIEVTIPLQSAPNTEPVIRRLLEGLNWGGRRRRRIDFWRGLRTGEVPRQPEFKAVLLCCRLGDLKDDRVRSLACRELLEIRDGSRSRFPFYLILTGLESFGPFNEFVSLMGESRGSALAEAVGIAISMEGAAPTELDKKLREVAQIFRKWRLCVLERYGRSVQDEFDRAYQRARTDAERTEAENTYLSTAATGRADLFELPRVLTLKSEAVASFCSTVLAQTKNADEGPLIRGIFYSGLLFKKPDTRETVDYHAVSGTRVFAWNLLTEHLLTANSTDTSRDPLRAYRELSEQAKRRWRTGINVTYVVVVLFLLCILVSGVSNILAVYRSRTIAAELVSSVPLEGIGSLQKTREQFESVKNNPPFWKRFGLYQGDRIKAELQAIYYNRAADLLVNPILGELERVASSSSPIDSSNVIRLYSMLHRRNGCANSQTFLIKWAPFYWANAQHTPPTAAPAILATRELTDLVNSANLSKIPADRLLAWNQGVIEKALTQFTQARNFDDVYTEIVQTANQEKGSLADILRAEPERIPELLKEHSASLTGGTEMLGAYLIKNSLSLRKQIDGWRGQMSIDVCIPYTDAQVNRQKDTGPVQPAAKYVTEYGSNWKRFLESAKIKDFSLGEAPERLRILAGERSPLLAVLAFVSNNTFFSLPADAASRQATLQNDDLALVSAQFDPVHKIVPPGPDRWNGGWWNDVYRKSLLDLRDVVTNANEHPSEKALRKQVRDISDQAIRSIELLQFTPGAGGVDTDVKNLLKSPFILSRAKVPEEGTGELNGMLASFCRDVKRLRGQDETVTLQDIENVLDPMTGSYLRFSSAGWVRRSSKTEPWQPGLQSEGLVLDPRFLEFLNRVSRKSNAFFHEGKPVGFDFTVEMKSTPPEMKSELKVGGAGGSLKAESPNILHFSWPGPNPTAGFQLITPGADVKFNGLWGLYSMIRNNQPDRSGNRVVLETVRYPNGTTVELKHAGQPGQVELLLRDLPGGFDGPFADLNCPSSAAHR